MNPVSLESRVPCQRSQRRRRQLIRKRRDEVAVDDPPIRARAQSCLTKSMMDGTSCSYQQLKVLLHAYAAGLGAQPHTTTNHPCVASCSYQIKPGPESPDTTHPTGAPQPLRPSMPSTPHRSPSDPTSLLEGSDPLQHCRNGCCCCGGVPTQLNCQLAAVARRSQRSCAGGLVRPFFHRGPCTHQHHKLMLARQRTYVHSQDTQPRPQQPFRSCSTRLQTAIHSCPFSAGRCALRSND